MRGRAGTGGTPTMWRGKGERGDVETEDQEFDKDVW